VSEWTARPGVHRLSAPLGRILAEAEGAGIAVHLVDSPRTKTAALDAIGAALSFPSWYGRNLDALEDCLRDLSWLPEGAHALIWVNSSALREHAVFEAILAGARPLHVVLLDADDRLGR
jgi:hypothetical protein